MRQVRLLTVVPLLVAASCQDATAPQPMAVPKPSYVVVIDDGGGAGGGGTTPKLDPATQTATVWWAKSLMKGLATTSYYGNGIKITMKITGGGQSETGVYENSSLNPPVPGYDEAAVEVETNISCGASATGHGTYRAEVHLASGITLMSTELSKDAQSAPQPSCDGYVPIPDGGGYGGYVDPPVPTGSNVSVWYPSQAAYETCEVMEYHYLYADGSVSESWYGLQCAS